MNKLELARKLMESNVVFHEPVALRNGERSDFYVDVKKAYGNPDILRAMAQLTLAHLDPATTCIAASGYGGIPLGTAISLESGLPLASVRDQEKNHGRRGLVDGYVPTVHDIVSVVDDVFTSGSSLRQTISNLAPTNPEIIACYVVIARGDVTKFDEPVSYLFKPEDIFNGQ